MVEIFGLKDVIGNVEGFLLDIAKFHSMYEPDDYLLRQSQVMYLKNNHNLSWLTHETLCIAYYLGNIDLKSFLNNIVPTNRVNELLASLNKMKSYRKRLIANYEVLPSLEVHRTKPKNFTQESALVSHGEFDFRLFERKFKETPLEMDSIEMISLIQWISKKIFSIDEYAKKINVTLHCTLIDAPSSDDAHSNSPEGIHQDGMDFIVSALVIERKNIKGGVSKIYLDNKIDPLLSYEIAEGYGIFQSDKGTALWHEVTPIKAILSTSEGYRSTLGFDMEVIK